MPESTTESDRKISADEDGGAHRLSVVVKYNLPSILDVCKNNGKTAGGTTLKENCRRSDCFFYFYNFSAPPLSKIKCLSKNACSERQAIYYSRTTFTLFFCLFFCPIFFFIDVRIFSKTQFGRKKKKTTTRPFDSCFSQVPSMYLCIYVHVHMRNAFVLVYFLVCLTKGWFKALTGCKRFTRFVYLFFLSLIIRPDFYVTSSQNILKY